MSIKFSISIVNPQLEFHLWSILGTSLCLKLIHRVKAKDAGKDVLGELTDDDVVLLNDTIELVTGLVDAVFSTLQLHLQVAEVLVGLQVGIVLLDGNQTAESST